MGKAHQVNGLLKSLTSNELGGHVFSASLFAVAANAFDEPQALCRDCQTPNDCDASAPNCVSSVDQGNISSCMPSCQNDQDCVTGSLCIDQQCRPKLNRVCKGNEIWLYDSCGHELGSETICPQSCVHRMCTGMRS